MTPYSDRFIGPRRDGPPRQCGHTMGTPGLDLRQSLELFARLGFEGAEIRSAKDGCFNGQTAGTEELDDARRAIADTGVAIVCLTPYYNDFRDAGRERTMAGMRRSIELAWALDCPLVRAKGNPDPEGVPREELIAQTVDGLRELGDIAAEHGVCLGIETHGGTISYTAAETRELVERIDHPNVGVILDYPWIWRAKAESPADAVELLAPYLVHVHVKGWVRTEKGADSALIGEDEVPWPEVVAALEAAEYGGWYSHEYEKFWYPDLLPEPEVGIANDRDRIREYVAAARSSG